MQQKREETRSVRVKTLVVNPSSDNVYFYLRSSLRGCFVYIFLVLSPRRTLIALLILGVNVLKTWESVCGGGTELRLCDSLNIGLIRFLLNALLTAH